MRVALNVCAETDRRCDRRYALPALEIVIGDDRFRAVNWSMRGALLYGFCEPVGTRLRGEIGLPGSSEGMPFTATVVRTDSAAGNTAIWFEDCRTERIDFPDRDGAALLQ